MILLNKHWAKLVWRENVSIPIYTNVIVCAHQRFEVKISANFLVYVVWPQFSNWAIQKWRSWAKNLFKFARYDDTHTVFFGRSIWTDGLEVKASHSESGNIGLNTAGYWKFLQLLGYFAWHRARQWTEYCCALYIFFLSQICRWWSRADRVLTRNINIWLPPRLLSGSGPWLWYVCWPGALAEITAIV